MASEWTSGIPNLINSNQNLKGNKKMTFTNTKSVENNWYWHEVKCQVQVAISDQVMWKVYDQITQIKTKIKQELNK